MPQHVNRSTQSTNVWHYFGEAVRRNSEAVHRQHNSHNFGFTGDREENELVQKYNRRQQRGSEAITFVDCFTKAGMKGVTGGSKHEII